MLGLVYDKPAAFYEAVFFFKFIALSCLINYYYF